MSKLQFQVLYQQFLFRMVDLELGVLVYVGTAFILGDAVRWEESGLTEDPGSLAVILGYLAGALLLLRWRNLSQAASTQDALEFETIQPPEILPLGLHRDGGPLA